MTVSLLKITLSIVGFALFITSFIYFAIYVPVYNSPSQNIINNPSIVQYSSSLNSTLSTFSSEANTAEAALSNSSVSIGGSANLLDSTRGIWKIVTQSPKIIYATTVSLLLNIFGNSPIVGLILGTSAALVIVLIVFGVIKLVAQGE